jgi:hypothetical protein
LAPEQIEASFVGLGAGPLESPGVGLGPGPVEETGPLDAEATALGDAGGVSDGPGLDASEALGPMLGGRLGATLGATLAAGPDVLAVGAIVGAAEPQATTSRIAPARSRGSRAVQTVRGRRRVTGQA